MDMKVGPVQIPNISEVKATKERVTEKDFAFTLLSKIDESELQEKLERMIEDITVQGKKLAEHMDVKDLKKYRTMVAEFMNEVVSRSHKFSRENFLDIMATQKGLEPSTSGVTGRRSNQLSHWAK